jgi:hypothetical protein
VGSCEHIALKISADAWSLSRKQEERDRRTEYGQDKKERAGGSEADATTKVQAQEADQKTLGRLFTPLSLLAHTLICATLTHNLDLAPYRTCAHPLHSHPAPTPTCTFSTLSNPNLSQERVGLLDKMEASRAGDRTAG